MIFTETKLKGVFIIEPQCQEDERGFFARTWCRREFEARGLSSDLVQCSISFNKRRGTLRGMHYQAAPFQETKLVRCTRGAIYDVVLDLRPDSPRFGQWVAVELNADNRRMLYVPAGCAHGLQTLADATEVFYQIANLYVPEAANGVRWNDPAFAIRWPLDAIALSAKDRAYPDWAGAAAVAVAASDGMRLP